MPIVVTIYVSSPSSILFTYDQIKVYSSDYEDGAYLEATDASTRLDLSVSQKYYNFEDLNGTSSTWYKTAYFNSSTLVESSLSMASRGIEVENEHVESSYPAEISLTSSDFFDVGRIRHYIGDRKKVKHDYVSPQCTAGYQNVSGDGKTYKLEDRGWPLRVEKDSVEYIDSSNPYVTDYRYLTFSGTIINTSSGVLSVWYESFRFSSREILKIYNTTPNPPYVASSAVTEEMLRLSAAISIIREELVQLMGETSGKVSLDGHLSYDPEPLLRQKRELLKDLEGKLDVFIEEARMGNITGVRVD